MDFILGHDVKNFCVNYLDDLAVLTSESFEQHLQHIDIVLEKLEKAGLTYNVEKCRFLCKEVLMLGYIISTNGLKTDPEKIKAIQDFPVPKKLKQLRPFLGLCNFYRRFVPNYNKYTRPLYDLLKKNVLWHWGALEQRAFDNVKASSIEVIQLHHPDFSKPFYLQTDSSMIGSVGVLYQLGDNGDMRILGFHSKALRGPQYIGPYLS